MSSTITVKRVSATLLLSERKVVVKIIGQAAPQQERVVNEPASGLINGSNANFQTLFPYIAGSLQVFLNGQLLRIVDDYQEVPPQSFTLTSSPTLNELITINYTKNA